MFDGGVVLPDVSVVGVVVFDFDVVFVAVVVFAACALGVCVFGGCVFAVCVFGACAAFGAFACVVGAAYGVCGFTDCVVFCLGGLFAAPPPLPWACRVTLVKSSRIAAAVAVFQRFMMPLLLTSS